MGVIQRQSIKQSIISYTAVIIGVISTLWIYPLDLSTYGYAQFLISTAYLISPLLHLGISQLVVRFFPADGMKNGDKGFLMMLLVAFLIVFTIMSSSILLFKSSIIDCLQYLEISNTKVLLDNLESILIISFLLILITILGGYASNYLRIVIPAIFNNLLFKIALPVLVILQYQEILDLVSFKQGILISYVIILVCLLIYCLRIGKIGFKIDPSIRTKPKLREMGKFSLISIIGGLGSMIAFRLDNTMISTMIDTYHTGIYSLILFMTTIIEIPFKSIYTIATPIISKSWKTNDIAEIKKIYRKSSLILFIVGGILFVLIYTNIQDIFAFTAKAEALKIGTVLFLYLGLAKLTDVTTGLNTQIIAQSKYYSFNLYAILFLSVSAVVSNYYFITAYGIVGAALATLLSFSLYNLLKLVFIYVRFKMQPFSIQHLISAGIIGFGWACTLIVPKIDIILLPIVLRGTILIAVCLPLFYFLKISEDLNGFVDKVLNGIKNKFSR